MAKWLSMLAAAALVVAGAVFALQKDTAVASATTEHSFSGGQMQWAIADYPALALEENTFILTVADEEGNPLTGASMVIMLEMMNMICGDMSFELHEIAPGKYSGEGIPLMPGTWRAVLKLDHNGQATTVERLLTAVR